MECVRAGVRDVKAVASSRVESEKRGSPLSGEAQQVNEHDSHYASLHARMLFPALDFFEIAMEDISVHDNFLISYSVFCRKREIYLHTAFLDKEPHEYTDVVFSGVTIYHFECDNLDTIIFDIEEAELEDIYAEYENLFSRLKNYAWVTFRYESKEELIRKMREKNVKAFTINSSHGLAGWVWAESMSKKPRDTPKGEI